MVHQTNEAQIEEEFAELPDEGQVRLFWFVKFLVVRPVT
jgi:hypothetical protein